MSAAKSRNRPVGVGPRGQFDPSDDCWVVADLDERGRSHGICQRFDARGTLLFESSYVEGQLQGPFRHFHPNGQLAREGLYVDGVLDGEVVVYASSDPSHARIRACCVPPAARSLRTQYRAGRRLTEDFYDAEGRRLLDDGSLYPQRPAAVPAAARFVAHESRWEHGNFDAEHRLHAAWAWWSMDGSPTEEAYFEHGQRHGLCRRFALGAPSCDEEHVSWSCDFVLGVPHGALRERVEAGTYADERIVERSGLLVEGRRCGPWRLSDGQSRLIREVDYGEAVPARDLLAAIVQGRPSAANNLVVELHSRLLSGELSAPVSAERVAQWLRSNSALLSAAASQALLEGLRVAKLDFEEHLLALGQAPLDGADAALVLRGIANLLIETPARALVYAKLAAELADEKPEYLVTRALLQLAVGDLAAANSDIERLGHCAEAAAQHLLHVRDCLFPRFDFWPAGIVFAEHESSELPTQVEQTLAALQAAVAKSTLRLAMLRAAVLEGLSDVAAAQAQRWLPKLPESASAIATLESYGFAVEDETGGDNVVVDERLKLDGLSLSELMRLMRVEWAGLCWLCWAAGLSSVQWPTQLNSPADFGRAIVTAFQRHWRVQDRLQTGGLRARMQRVPGFQWQGRSVDELSRQHAQWALAEQLEMRAVLYFLGDASCRSLWQDDLRG